MLNKEIDYQVIAKQKEKECSKDWLLITHSPIYKAGNVEVNPPTYTQRIR